VPALVRVGEPAPFPDRHLEFQNVVALPLTPVGFAQASLHFLALVFDGDDQVGFFRSIRRHAMQHPDGLVGTFGDHDRVARFEVDGLPRLVQIEAEGFVHNGSSTIMKDLS
jgi:hypothetical protein